MFNSFMYSQASSTKRISFNYEIATGTPFVYTVSNNKSGVNRRSRLELSSEGYSIAGSTQLAFLPSSAITGAIVFDRDNMMQTISWAVTGSTDTIVGPLDLSTQTNLRGAINISGHGKLTAITLASIINPSGYSNSATTEFRVNDNDLRNVDLSPFQVFGKDSEVSYIRLFNNSNLTGFTTPVTNKRVSLGSIRNTNLTSLNLTGLTGLIGVVAENNPSLTSVTFPSSIVSAATGDWNFEITGIKEIDFSVLGPNFGGRIDLFQNTALTAITFPACYNSINSFFMRSCGLTANDVIDMTPLTGISTSFTLRNQNGIPTFPVSDRSISFFYTTALQHVRHLDLRTFSNLNGQFWCTSNAAMTAVTTGNWSNSFYQFYISGHESLVEINMTGATGIGGDILLHNNPLLTAATLPITTNTIDQIWFRENDSFGYFDMKPISGGSNDNIFLDFDDNPSWDAGITNHMLHDIDNFGWENGILHITGTTALYDGSSGGYNGTAHYNNLIGKGWTIITS